MQHPPKYPSTPHWPWSQTVHRDDSYHQTPERFVGVDVVITEKLDGGNTCLWNGEVYARSTTQPAAHAWMGMVRKYHAWKTIGLREDLVFYGEDLFGVHSIEYEPIREEETFRLFSTRYVSTNGQGSWFSDWELVESHAQEIGVKTVPLLFQGRFRSTSDITDWFETHIQQPSQLGGECEGFVMRVEKSFDQEEFAHNVCKYVRADHIQTDEHWTRNWQPCKLKE